MDIIELTRKLGAAIQRDPRYTEHAMARQANDQDEALQDMIGQFNLLRMSINTEMSKEDGEKNDEKVHKLNEELKACYGKIMDNENMKRYQAANDALEAMMKQINGILALCVNGEDPETCDPTPSGCSGSCSSCAGCH